MLSQTTLKDRLKPSVTEKESVMLHNFSMRFDLHVHTTASPCSSLKFEDIITHASRLGLDGVCITDHNKMSITKTELKKNCINGLCIICGMEYSTKGGDFLVFGQVDDLPHGLDSTALLNKVNNLGGIAVAAHPFRAKKPVNEYVLKEGLCKTVESLNGRNKSVENQMMEKWRNKYSFHETGGSDAHSLEELGKIVTRFTVPVKCCNDLVYALKNGFCYPEQR